MMKLLIKHFLLLLLIFVYAHSIAQSEIIIINDKTLLNSDLAPAALTFPENILSKKIFTKTSEIKDSFPQYNNAKRITKYTARRFNLTTLELVMSNKSLWRDTSRILNSDMIPFDPIKDSSKYIDATFVEAFYKTIDGKYFILINRITALKDVIIICVIPRQRLLSNYYTLNNRIISK